MNRRLHWKLVFILAVVIGTSAIAWFPPLAGYLGLSGPPALTENRLRLGLDLEGGVEFVLRVNADEALGTDAQYSRDEIVAQARNAVDRRVNALGVVEPLVAIQGDQRDEIVVQLPGFTDVERARAILGATARLEWRLVEAGPASTREALLARGMPPVDAEVLAHADPAGADNGAPSAFYLVRRTAEVGGRDIRHASATRDDLGQPAVGFSLTSEGGRRFAELTSGSIGRQLAIVLDDRVQSAPVIEGAITGGEGVIRGGFTVEEAADLTLLLQSGSLPVSMTFLGGQYVGPTLGATAVQAGVTASIGGLLLVAAFMLLYYRRAGVNAVVSVVANLAILLGLMASLGAALTLPGIAGLILTIGMGVDSNVLIFERIKEEMKAGEELNAAEGANPRRSVRRAVAAGFDRVFLTILDTHVASLIAAAFLFQFGSGPIRGFATTLSLGLLTNLFTAAVVSRAMFEWTLSRGQRLTLGSGWLSRLAARASLDVMSYRRVALWAAAVLVAASVTVTLARGLPLGIDFTGGTSVVSEFDAPVSEDDVRRAMPGDSIVQRYGPEADRALLIRVPVSPTDTGDGDITSGVRLIEATLGASDLPSARTVGSTTIGPSIGKDLQRKGAWAMIASLAGISAYLALRFRPSFATGAAVAVVHDIAVTVAMLSIFGYDLNLNIVAAILTVAGYSVNDTIVIFDRVRERLRTTARGVLLGPAVNAAVADTLGRTIITSGTTFAAVLALYLFGGTALEGFAFTLLVGIVVGTWSSVFVAAPIAALVGSSRATD